MYSFYGKILKIDLTRASTEEIKIPAEDYRLYLGGSGLAAHLYDQGGYAYFDPLAEEAPLIILNGLLTGFNVPTASKASFCGKSPATNIWAEAIVGGYWPAALKTSGYDGLLITGRASKPVYLYLDEGRLAFKEASFLWGQDVYATAESLIDTHGEKARVAAIGPAGENKVPMAAIIIDGHDARAAGRCGLGALMGSKNLKAVVVQRGSLMPAVHNSELLQQSRRKMLPQIREKAKGLSDFGTAGGVPVVERLGDLPIRNWAQGSWPEGAEKVSGQAMDKKYFSRHYACYACPIRCGKEMRVPIGPYEGTLSHGPEYETIAGFGAMCLNEDPEYVIAANDLCNRLGIDTISSSAAIAFAMELNEHGLIPAPLLEGLNLAWGEGEVILTLLEQIAAKKGLGKILGQGVKRAALEFGPLAKEFAIESKGLEVPYHDPRAFTSMALIYATALRGACHLEGLTYYNENMSYPASLVGLEDEFAPHESEGKALLAKTMQDYMSVFNALGLCKFLLRGHVRPQDLALWTEAVTGWQVEAEELLLAGERIFNLKRKINVGLGVSRKDDTLPPRLLTHDRLTGGAAGGLPHLGKMLGEYYKLRGWSAEGIPEEQTLKRLSLF